MQALNNLQKIHSQLNQLFEKSKDRIDLEHHALFDNIRQGNKVFIMRHGEVDMNSKNVLKGQQEFPLNRAGIQQSKELGEQMKDKKLDMVMSSDLGRAQHTAQIVAKKTGVPLKVIPAQKPWHFGAMQGQKVEKALPVLTHLVKNEPDRPIPGGESFNQFKDRSLGSLVAALKQNPGKRIGLVTQSRNDKLMDAWQKKDYPKDLSVDKDEFLKTFRKVDSLKPGEFETKNVRIK